MFLLKQVGALEEIFGYHREELCFVSCCIGVDIRVVIINILYPLPHQLQPGFYISLINQGFGQAIDIAVIFNALRALR